MPQIPEKPIANGLQVPLSLLRLVNQERKDFTMHGGGGRAPCTEVITPAGQPLDHPGRILIICVGEYRLRANVMDFMCRSADAGVGRGEDSVYASWDCHDKKMSSNTKKGTQVLGEEDASNWRFYTFSLGSSRNRIKP